MIDSKSRNISSYSAHVACVGRVADSDTGIPYTVNGMCTPHLHTSLKSSSACSTTSGAGVAAPSISSTTPEWRGLYAWAPRRVRGSRYEVRTEAALRKGILALHVEVMFPADAWAPSC